MRDRFATRQIVPDPSAARRYRESDGVSALALDPIAQFAAPLICFVVGADAVPRIVAREEVQTPGDVFTRRRSSLMR